jgi:hypothetical protein
VYLVSAGALSAIEGRRVHLVGAKQPTNSIPPPRPTGCFAQTSHPGALGSGDATGAFRPDPHSQPLQLLHPYCRH